MTSDKAGMPADSPSVVDDKDITAADITQPDDDSQEKDHSPALVERTKTNARRLSRKVGGVVPKERKRRWAAVTAAVTATAGLAAGWVIRRGRDRRLPWPRRGR